ncbi:NAD(P)-dependent oxidoreductase [Herbiconiux sp. L3-i23]|uniref:NAD(P)-dependent oxidoreductase n=1 Tax=Herbiconiux sp. L3-i23 TaxID=2905871 RepID=UPI00206DBE50|nr:NAD(P)-dependent oxidoreductase [Herbiconiux sp. L3-i23]BDI21376.1 dehydrogenase [Herbiconiux sp. L3-i23]
MKSSVAVLGLGRMGLPVASRLRDAGREVVVFDVDPSRAAAARAAGLPVATDAVTQAAEVDVLLTVLPGPGECEAAMLGGVLDAMRPGSLWLDLTSNSPSVAERIARAAADRGVAAVAAPMLGGPDDAERGSLGFYLAGEAAALDVATPILHDLGDESRLLRAGDRVAQAHVAKLAVNGLWFSQVVAVTEMLLLAQAHGLSAETFQHILESSPARSEFTEAYLPRLISGDYIDSFGVDRVVEELDEVVRLAAAAGTPSASIDAVTTVHADALARYGPIGGEMLAARHLRESAAADSQAVTTAS